MRESAIFLVPALLIRVCAPSRSTHSSFPVFFRDRGGTWTWKEGEENVGIGMKLGAVCRMFIGVGEFIEYWQLRLMGC